MHKWVMASADAQQRATSSDSVASISHSAQHAVVMTTNKEKSGLGIEQDVQIHRAVETSEAEAQANVYRRVALNGGVAESASCVEAEMDQRLGGEYANAYVIGDEPGESGTDRRGDETPRTPTGHKQLVHKTDTMDFHQVAAASDHPPGSPFVLRSAPGDAATAASDTQLGGCTPEELQDEPALSWSSTVPKEARSLYTRKYMKRQDLIWELIATERNYVRMLCAVKDVYRAQFLSEFVNATPTPSPTAAQSPGPDTTVFTPQQAERLFPCVDRLAQIHGRLLHRLCEQQQRREDRAIHYLGDLLLGEFTGAAGQEMVEVYGEFYARHLQGKKLLAELRHSSARFSAYLSRCESNPLIRRRSLDDIYLIINQRFSKLESLVVVIIENTINQAEESEKLNQAKTALKEITFRAEELLGDSQNKEMLDRIVDNFDRRCTTGSALQRPYSLDDITSGQRRIVHYGKLRVYRSAVIVDSSNKSSSQPCKQGIVDCLGLLFSDLFVLLQENGPDSERRYQFLKEDGPAPSILPFAYLSNCIIRESPQRHNGEYELYVIFNHDNACFRYSLYTGRQDERAKWAKMLSDAAMNTELKTEETDESLGDRLSAIEEKFKSGCEALSHMQKTDWELERLINIKAALWQRYLECWDMTDLQGPAEDASTITSVSSSNQDEKDGSSESSADVIDLIPNVDDIEGMMKMFSREATKLHMLIHSCNTNLTRSASSAADQAFASGLAAAGRGSGPMGGRRGGGGEGGTNLPRRYETFSGYDSSTAGKMTAGIYGKRPSLETATSDESMGTGDKGSAKSDSTLKVKKRPGYILTSSFRLKLANNNTILRHPEGHSKKQDNSRRRSSVNIGNLLRSITKSSDKSSSHAESHSSASRAASAGGPTSPASPSASVGTPTSLASPAESAGTGGTGGTGTNSRLSSHWDWSNECLEAGMVNWRDLSTTAGPPNRSAVQSLSYLNSETRKLISTLSRLRTHLASMHNRLTRAEQESRTFQEQLSSRDRASWSGAQGSLGTSASSTGLSAHHDLGSGFHVVRETEKLRNQRAEMERERTEFAKERQRNMAKLETEREELMARQEELKRERQELAEAKERLADKEKWLQAQIEQHERRLNVRLDPHVNPMDLLYPSGASCAHSRSPSEDGTASLPSGPRVAAATTRRDSLQSVQGPQDRRQLVPPKTAPHSTSLLSLSQGGSAGVPAPARETSPAAAGLHPAFPHVPKGGPVSRSTSDLTLNPAAPPDMPARHMLPLQLAEHRSHLTLGHAAHATVPAATHGNGESGAGGHSLTEGGGPKHKSSSAKSKSSKRFFNKFK